VRAKTSRAKPAASSRRPTARRPRRAGSRQSSKASGRKSRIAENLAPTAKPDSRCGKEEGRPGARPLAGSDEQQQGGDREEGEVRIDGKEVGQLDVRDRHRQERSGQQAGPDPVQPPPEQEGQQHRAGVHERRQGAAGDGQVVELDMPGAIEQVARQQPVVRQKAGQGRQPLQQACRRHAQIERQMAVGKVARLVTGNANALAGGVWGPVKGIERRLVGLEGRGPGARPLDGRGHPADVTLVRMVVFVAVPVEAGETQRRRQEQDENQQKELRARHTRPDEKRPEHTIRPFACQIGRERVSPLPLLFLPRPRRQPCPWQ
jgi:hypothetical protein